jgi:O-antigen/teichoic acid export membrane protein
LGVIEKQAFKNTIWSYVGLVLGYVNVIILFPAFFTTEQFGLVQLIQSISVVYAQFSAVGLVNIIIRYFPFFKTEDKKHLGFLSWVLLIMLGGFIIITIIYLVFRPLIIGAYIERSALFVEYFYVLIPLSLFALVFNVIESFVRVIHKTVFSAFLKDVFFRFITTIGIFLVYFKILSFTYFVLYYMLSFFVIAFLVFLQMVVSRQFKFSLDFKSIGFKKIGEIIKYGMFTLMAGSSYFFAQNIDKIMLASMVGLQIVGVYSVFLFMATVVIFHARSLYRITVPIVADCWKNDDREQIKMIYRRSSLILMIFGSIIFIGILVNMDNISYFLKAEYRANFLFFVFLGLSFLIDMSGGMNSDIINTSPKYKFDTLFNLVYMVLCVALNYIFIKLMGGLGAAIAMVLAMFIFNFMKWLFLEIKYKMQPFNFKNLLVLIITSVSFLAGWYFPVIKNVYLDILARSMITTFIYFGALIIFRVSDDINRKFYDFKKMIFK